MSEKSQVIFGNKLPDSVYQKAVNSRKKYERKYGDDSSRDYEPVLKKNPVIGDSLGVIDIRLKEGKDGETGLEFDHEKGIIVGNIRMGFGHYRISMAMASAARSMGYTPYWLDLNSFPETTCTKVISAQNDLYSLGSRMSKNAVFNKLVWEPVNYEGFRKLSYNASDQENARLMAPVYKNIPKDIPVIATHVWPAQAALHAGMKNVVNAIPDNWPMALHLAEGSVHTIQCRNAYMGYRILNGMDGDKVLNPIPDDQLVYTGHYIDDELVKNIEKDCDNRISRRKNNAPFRFLLTIGGAGAQKDIFEAIIRHLLPSIKQKKAALYVNVGDYRNVWDEMLQDIPDMKIYATEHFENFKEASEFAADAADGSSTDPAEIRGIHGFYHSNIFEAVYITNLLMRSADVLVTKPSELAFYPVPKLFIRRVGKHEMWGAIHSAEMGDGTLECRDIPHTEQMLDLFMKDEHLLSEMCDNIKLNKTTGLYDGAYKAVQIAADLRAGKR